MEQNQAKSEIIGSTGSASVSFSFTRQELDDLKRFLKPGAPGKPERVYLTLRSGYSTKTNRNYSMITVESPEGGNNSHVATNTRAQENVPF